MVLVLAIASIALANAAAGSSSSPPPDFKAEGKKWTTLIQSGSGGSSPHSDSVANSMVDALSYFESESGHTQKQLTQFARVFLKLIVQSNFAFGRDSAERLLKKQPTLATVLALTKFNSTDRYAVVARSVRAPPLCRSLTYTMSCRVVSCRVFTSALNELRVYRDLNRGTSSGERLSTLTKSQENVLMWKTLILTTPRSSNLESVYIKHELVVQMPDVSGFWVSSFIRSYDMSLVNHKASDKIMTCLKDLQWWNVIDEFVNTVYFAVSYIDSGGPTERNVKSHINAIFKVCVMMICTTLENTTVVVCVFFCFLIIIWSCHACLLF